jgi:hypothetical protein
MGSTASSFGDTVAAFSCHKLTNDHCRDCMTPRGLGEIGLQFRDEGLGAGECAFH